MNIISIPIIIFLIHIELSISDELIKWAKSETGFINIRERGNLLGLSESFQHTSGRLENSYDLNGKKIGFISYNRKYIYEIYDGGTRVTGFYGEMWNVIAKLMNFTMIVKEADPETFFANVRKYHNCSGTTMLAETNECDIVPFFGINRPIIEGMDPTNCFNGDELRFLSKPYHHLRATWIIEIYSPEMWYSVIVSYVILGLISTTMILARNSMKNNFSPYLVRSIIDNYFNCFGALCNQGSGFYSIQQDCRILSFSISMFTWLLITSFSSQIYVFMTQSALLPPFKDLDTLFYNTDYNILIINQGPAHAVFEEEKAEGIHQDIISSTRVKFFSTFQSIWDETCSGNGNNAIFHLRDHQAVQNWKDPECQIEPIGEVYRRVCIAAALPKNFIHKAGINHKLWELGIGNKLRNEWFQRKNSKTNHRSYSPIALDGIYLPILIYISGICLSVSILTIEKIIQSVTL